MSQELSLRVYGMRDTRERVRADVFARQISGFVDALRAADKIANGTQRLDYVITELDNKSALIAVDGILRTKLAPDAMSGDILYQVIEGIKQADKEEIKRGAPCFPGLSKIFDGANKRFSHADMFLNKKPVLVDTFLSERLTRAKKLATQGGMTMYEGATFTEFDGVVEAVDIRGDIPKLILTLSAGRKQINCTWYDISPNELGQRLNVRSWVRGKAYYSGKSGLPSLLEIKDAVPIRQNVDFSKWHKSFKDFSIESWD
jgi:hypothetical protein